jgi:hypothetical protein
MKSRQRGKNRPRPVCILVKYRDLNTRYPANCGPVLRIRNPVAFRPRDPGKKSGSGSRLNSPDHIFVSLETIFWVKIFKFFDVDPGSGMEKIRIRDKHGSVTLIVSLA